MRPSSDYSPPPGLDLTGAAIQAGDGSVRPERHAVRGAPSILLPHQQAGHVSHIAIDIGGSLIKLVYFAGGEGGRPSSSGGGLGVAGGSGATTPAPSPPRRVPGRGGKLHFVKFETAKMDDCLAFIESRGLHKPAPSPPGAPAALPGDRPRFVATGGGAYRFADLFEARLGVVLEKEDEMECLVAGADFLLRAIRAEAFAYIDGAIKYSGGEGGWG